MTQSYTPIPWEIGYTNRSGRSSNQNLVPDQVKAGPDTIMCFGNNKEANAAFIVHACNAHEDLVKALKDAHAAVLKLAAERDPDQLGMWDAIFIPAKAALIKAGE